MDASRRSACPTRNRLAASLLEFAKRAAEADEAYMVAVRAGGGFTNERARMVRSRGAFRKAMDDLRPEDVIEILQARRG